MNIGSVVVSRVKQDKVGFKSVYIGRSRHKNALCNPFAMKHESERDCVCEQFKEHFDKNVKIENNAIRNEIIKLFNMLKKGQNINLQCFCAPKRCHGHTIKDFLDKYIAIWLKRQSILNNK